MRVLYRYLIRPLLELFARIAAMFSPRLKQALAGRREWRTRLPDNLAGEGGGARIWVHAPSLGELLLVEEVLRQLPAQPLPRRILVTVTSPSALGHAGTISEEVRFATFLPPDSKKAMDRLLDDFKPGLILISQYDIWPNMVWEAAARKIPMALVGAALRPGSSKTSGPPRSLYRDLYGRLDYVGAISEADRQRLADLGVSADRLELTGDPRFDRVARMTEELSVPDLPLPADRLWLVAGSTWPEDEQHLLPALVTAREPLPELSLAIAPHEVTARRLEEIEDAVEALGLSCVRFSQIVVGEPCPEVVIVDRFGLLIGLYAIADIAYVGGGFGEGVHNVLEPASRGAPIMFGPAYDNAREARMLVQHKLAVPGQTAEDFSVQLEEWLLDEDRREKLRRQAKELVEQNCGAAPRTARALCSRFTAVLGEPPPESGHA